MTDSPFNADSISKAIHASLDSAIAGLPADKNHAILLDATRADGLRGVLVMREPGGWTVAIEGAWAGPHKLSAGVQAIKAW